MLENYKEFMLRNLLMGIVVLTSINGYCQKRTAEVICSTDTMVIDPSLRMGHYIKKLDSTNIKPYKVVQCQTLSKVGFRFELGVSNYNYEKRTSNWLGQHSGPSFNFILAVDNLSFGIRFKPWTINPKKEMEFNGVTVPKIAELNTIKIDYYAGYSFDFNRLISLEPYIGYNRSSFLVINQDELKQDFSFAKTGGMLLGSTLNKYFKVKDFSYISLFGSLGYSFVNFEKVHPELDNGYLDWTIGIAYKGFLPKRFNRIVD
jgi:hypothetical protein